jgi:hypothetical protein
MINLKNDDDTRKISSLRARRMEIDLEKQHGWV